MHQEFLLLLLSRRDLQNLVGFELLRPSHSLLRPAWLKKCVTSVTLHVTTDTCNLQAKVTEAHKQKHFAVSFRQLLFSYFSSAISFKPFLLFFTIQSNNPLHQGIIAHLVLVSFIYGIAFVREEPICI